MQKMSDFAVFAGAKSFFFFGKWFSGRARQLANRGMGQDLTRFRPAINKRLKIRRIFIVN